MPPPPPPAVCGCLFICENLQLWSGAALNGVGSALRVVAAVHLSHGHGMFWLLMVGQSLCAVAQPFGLFPPTLVAAVWFPADQRAIANMLASMGKEIHCLLLSFGLFVCLLLLLS